MYEQILHYLENSNIVMDTKISERILNIVKEAQDVFFDNKEAQIAFISALVEDYVGISENTVKEVIRV